MITVTAAVIELDGKILAARKKSGLHLSGLWEFPGGKVEPGESPEESLARELEEELGIRCTIGAFVGASIYRYGKEPIKLLGYFAAPLSTSFALTDHDQIRWLAPEELFSVDWAPADVPLAEKVQEKMLGDRTQEYYDKNAASYIRRTIDTDMESIRARFIGLLPEGAHILDLGCGSGRDSMAFLRLGFTVTATDASPAVASITGSFLCQEVRVEKAQDLSETSRYHGVWACASLLHIPRSDFPATLEKIVNALQPHGILYMSLKKETGRKWDALGRFANDLSGKEITAVIHSVKRAELLEVFETSSSLDDSEEYWLNFLVRKSGK